MIEEVEVVRRDRFGSRVVQAATGLLREFNYAGVLGAADVHVAQRLGALGGEKHDAVLLAAALAVRGVRMGHVFVDLSRIADTAAVDAEDDVDLSGLPWPAADGWLENVAASPLVEAGEAERLADRPLRLVGSHLYLDRYWCEERQVAADLLALAAGAVEVDVELLASGIERLFGPDGDDLQRIAAAAATLRRLAVVAGGPGTGKTTTVARVVALLAEQCEQRGKLLPLVALAAPTAKAAGRLEEALHDAASAMPVTEPVRAYLLSLGALTLHRLLGWRPDSHSRFRHDRDNPLPHSVVIVDETSMVSLTLMERLLAAVSPEAQLILVGDPGQLRSIEAGVVLGDIVGPAADGMRMSFRTREALSAAAGRSLTADVPPDGVALGEGIVVLQRVHRFGGGIARLAEAVRRGDGDGAVAILTARPDDLTWIPLDLEEVAAEDQLEALRAAAVSSGRAVIEAAIAGAEEDALDAVRRFRLLCAHRRGPHGVATWNARIEGWLAAEFEELDFGSQAYVGRPLLVTENDYELQLYNGDTGVIVQVSPHEVQAVFDRGGQPLRISPTRLEAIETVYAMTIHKSQGSQFETAAVLLPPPASRILTRELLYTASTRARERLIAVGTEEMILAAVGRPVTRASGLRERLWLDPELTHWSNA